MQANDAELTELYTASAGEEVENNEPNADNTAAGANTFDLRLQAVAGSVRGDDASDYKLGSTASTRRWRLRTST